MVVGLRVRIEVCTIARNYVFSNCSGAAAFAGDHSHDIRYVSNHLAFAVSAF